MPESIKQAIRLLTERYYDIDATEGHMEAVESLCWSFRLMEAA